MQVTEVTSTSMPQCHTGNITHEQLQHEFNFMRAEQKTEVYSALVELCTDICRRNGKRKLVWISDRDKALAYSVKSDEMLMTVHRWFAKKSCPGNWLFERMGSLADEVNHKISLSD